MKKPGKFLLVGISIFSLAIILFACGGGGGGGTTVNATGTWNGTISTSLVHSNPITLSLTQSSASLTGTYSLSDEVGGTVSGTVSGNIANITLTHTSQSCAGSFTGTATVNGDTMTFSFTGSDCLGQHANGQGTATRQGGGSGTVSQGEKTFNYTTTSPSYDSYCNTLFAAMGCSSASDCVVAGTDGHMTTSVADNIMTMTVPSTLSTVAPPLTGTLSGNSFVLTTTVSESDSGCNANAAVTVSSNNYDVTGSSFSGNMTVKIIVSGSCDIPTGTCNIAAPYTATAAQSAAGAPVINSKAVQSGTSKVGNGVDEALKAVLSY